MGRFFFTLISGSEAISERGAYPFLRRLNGVRCTQSKGSFPGPLGTELSGFPLQRGCLRFKTRL